MQIIVGGIALAFIVLVVFLVLTLQETRKTLRKVDRILTDAHHLLDAVSEPSVHVIHNLNKLTLDIKKKSAGLDVLFRPLYAMNKEDPQEHDKLSEIMGCLAEAIRLFRRVKNEIAG